MNVDSDNDDDYFHVLTHIVNKWCHTQCNAHEQETHDEQKTSSCDYSEFCSLRQFFRVGIDYLLKRYTYLMSAIHDDTEKIIFTLRLLSSKL